MVLNREDVGIAIRSAFLKKGAQQKFSLIALIVISIFFLYIDTFENKPLNTARSVIKDFIYRGSIIISLPGKGVGNSIESIKSHFSTREENIKLKKENITLKDSIHEQNFLLVENEQLKKLLEQDISSKSINKNAKVIIDKNSPFLKSIILNKGSKENLKKGMAVLDGNYFIGRLVEVNYFSSRVLLITDLNSKIPVIVEPNGYQAILSGTGEESPILDYLPKSHNINVGNIVYTSGKDGIFSPGIPIGEIELVGDDINVSLYSDFSQLSYVSVDLNEAIIDRVF